MVAAVTIQLISFSEELPCGLLCILLLLQNYFLWFLLQYSPIGRMLPCYCLVVAGPNHYGQVHTEAKYGCLASPVFPNTVVFTHISVIYGSAIL